MITFILILWWFLSTSPVQAQSISTHPIIFQDDFLNNDDLKNWSVVRNSQHHHPEKPCFNQGSPAQWSVINNKLGIDIDGIACTTEIIPTQLDLSTIDDYQVEFKWSFPTSTQMDRNMLIKWQDADNWYGLHIFGRKILLQKVIGGRSAALYQNWGYFDFVANQSYQFRVRVENNWITVWVDDHQVLHTVDRPPFLTGYQTMGFQASSGNVWQSSSWFSELVVSSLAPVSGKKLNLHLYQQTDPEWKGSIYDQARLWSSKPTIERWGCALTSMVMILDYYKIELLPTGQKLNPRSLNAWLNSQSDGYIGEGLLNWLAITRLTQIMSEELKTPVLEYNQLEGDVALAIDEINLDQPVILQIPGHFLVANGYLDSPPELLISDPVYDFDLLSQHQTDLLSVRSFKPSHTDLSYILIVHDPEIIVTLIDESGQMPANLKVSTEYILAHDNENEETTTPKIIQSLAKPENGKYLLKIDNSTEKEQLATIYAYDTQGQVTVFDQEITTPKILELNYDPEGSSRLSVITDEFLLLREWLDGWYETGEISTRYAYLKLKQLVGWALAEGSDRTRYRQLIIKTAQELEPFIPYSTVIRSLAPSN